MNEKIPSVFQELNIYAGPFSFVEYLKAKTMFKPEKSHGPS